jgi:hypothetical protein
MWNSKTYVITDDMIEPTKIGQEIGEVTRYSTSETSKISDSDNFSNAFKRGTKYFEIKGINTNEALAVEKEEGKFIKAIILDEWEKSQNQ